MSSPEMQPGVLIAFEGGEGAGKSTQISTLETRLRDAGRSVTRTREPGGSPIGARIRSLLLDPDSGDIDPRTEALLYAADRAQHAATVLWPALQAGQVVITDRYMDSSAVYQGYGRGLGLDPVKNLSLWATRDLRPDLTIVLDLDPAVGLRRASATEFGGADRMELAGLDFHRTVREGFLALAAADPAHYAVIDASRPVESVALSVWDAVADTLARR